MQSPEKVADTYNKTAHKYAADRIDELSHKHLDRLLLKEFAASNQHKGRCADLGCGPGQTTKFLYDHGITDVTGIDISSEMINTAHQLFPDINFETGDLLKISYPSNYFGSAVAFYSIVHFTHDQIKLAFSEINRVLKKEGQFLFSFHVGTDPVHFEKVGDIDVDIDLFFFQSGSIITLLSETGFNVVDALERQPYEGVEYPSRRAYILAEKN